MNEHELRRRRWDRLGRALNDAAGAAGLEIEDLIHEIVASMHAAETPGEEANAMPDPELVERLIAAATRKQTIQAHIKPVVDRLAKQATTFDPRAVVAHRVAAGTWR